MIPPRDQDNDDDFDRREEDGDDSPPGDEDADEWEDGEEDWEEGDDDEWADDGEDHGEEEEQEKRLPVPFKPSSVALTSPESRERLFAARKEQVTEKKKRGRKRKIFFFFIVPAVVVLMVALVIGYSVRRMILEKRDSEQKMARAAEAQQSSPNSNAALSGDEPDLARSLKTVRKLLEDKKEEDAKRLLLVMGKRFPNSPDVLVLQGWCMLGAAPASAGAYGRKALEFEPRHKEALDLVSAAFELTHARGLTAENEIKLRDLEIKYYESQLERAPDWPELLYRAASQRIAVHRLDSSRLDQLEKAISELEQAVGILSASDAPKDLASAHHQLGRAIKHQADQLTAEGKVAEAGPPDERALTEFGRALAADGNRVDSLGEIILIRERRGERDLAIAAVEAALPGFEMEAARAKAFEMQGVLFQKAGRLDEAAQRYEEALKTNERMIGSLVGLAGIHEARGELEDAREMLEKSVEVDPNFLEGFYRVGQFFFRQKRPRDAIASFEAALMIPRQKARTIDMYPSKNLAHSRYYYGAASALAWLYIEEENDPLKAGKAVELAQRFQKPEPHLLDTVGWIYYRSGNYEKAIDSLEKAIEASGEFPAAHYHLAASYAKVGRKEEALREVNRSLERDAPFAHRSEAIALRAELSGNAP